MEYNLITKEADGSGFIMAMASADTLAAPLNDDATMSDYDGGIPSPAPDATATAKISNDFLPPQGRGVLNPGRSGRARS